MGVRIVVCREGVVASRRSNLVIPLVVLLCCVLIVIFDVVVGYELGV